MSHESVLSAGCASAVFAPRPLTPPFEAVPLRAGVVDGFARGRRMPSAPEMSLEALEASAGGRPGRASSTGIVFAVPKLMEHIVSKSRYEGTNCRKSAKQVCTRAATVVRTVTDGCLRVSGLFSYYTLYQGTYVRV